MQTDFQLFLEELQKEFPNFQDKNGMVRFRFDVSQPFFSAIVNSIPVVDIDAVYKSKE